MEEKHRIRLAVVGPSGPIHQLLHHGAEFSSYGVSRTFPTDGDPIGRVEAWLGDQPSHTADVLCILSESERCVSLAERAIAQGLHVWSSGPLVRNPAEQEHLVARADSVGVTLICGGGAQFRSGASVALQAIASGRLGRPVFLRYLRLGADAGSRWERSEALTLATRLIGDTVTSVYAQLAGGCHLSIDLGYRRGGMATIALGAPSAAAPIIQLLVMGSRGACYDTASATASIYFPNGGVGPGDPHPLGLDEEGQSLARWANQCVQTVTDGTPPPVPRELTRHVLELSTLVDCSLERGEPLQVAAREDVRG